MSKVSTFLFLVNNHDEKQTALLNLDDLTNSKSSQYKDVYDALDLLKYSPSNETVQKIINFSHGFKV